MVKYDVVFLQFDILILQLPGVCGTRGVGPPSSLLPLLDEYLPEPLDSPVPPPPPPPPPHTRWRALPTTVKARVTAPTTAPA